MNPLESVSPESTGQDADDVEREGYGSGPESMPGSYGASHDQNPEVPQGGNPATTLAEEGFDDESPLT